MPTGTNTVYLDSTFTSVDAGYKEVLNELEIVDSDNIGTYELPIVYETKNAIATTINKDICFFVENTAISGVGIISLEFFREISKDFGELITLTDYTVSTDLSGALSNYVLFSTGYNTISGTVNEVISYIGGELFTSFKSYLVESENYPVISGSVDYWNTYLNYSGHTSSEGNPIPSIDSYFVSVVEYETKSSGVGGLLANVDITFAGWVDFPILSDVYSVDAGITDTYTLDVLTISGGVLQNYLDVYSTDLTTSDINFDVYCSLLDSCPLFVDVKLEKGLIGYLNCGVYSTIVDTPTISCDVGLFSLKITDFSLGIGEYTTASGYISVDVLDDIYGVSVSGTYFKVGGQIVPVTFSNIDNGYRMFYDPIDNFCTLEGSTIFTAHARNNNGDILEENFYLTFGYLVEYENYTRIGMDYGYNNKVTVRITAENYESCPKLSSDGHLFMTEQRSVANLSATIVGMFHASDLGYLSAEIYPLSTAYYYGKTFEVVINSKDFAGNIMKPVVIEYKIEDKPM